MREQKSWCDRSGHNPVLNRDGDAFVCSHDCGKRWARPGVATCALPAEWFARSTGEDTRRGQ